MNQTVRVRRHQNWRQLTALLEDHPGVALLPDEPVIGSKALIEFQSGSKIRTIWDHAKDGELRGPIELIDNNPLICADEYCFEISQLESLAKELVLAPLIRSQLIDPTACISDIQADGPWSHLTIHIPGVSGTMVRECLEEAYSRKSTVLLSWLTEGLNHSDIGPVLIHAAGEEQPVARVDYHAQGRLGPCGVIQAMNVMAGIDELLGLEAYF